MSSGGGKFSFGHNEEQAWRPFYIPVYKMKYINWVRGRDREKEKRERDLGCGLWYWIEKGYKVEHYQILLFICISFCKSGADAAVASIHRQTHTNYKLSGYCLLGPVFHQHFAKWKWINTNPFDSISQFSMLSNAFSTRLFKFVKELNGVTLCRRVINTFKQIFVPINWTINMNYSNLIILACLGHIVHEQ